MPLHKFRPHMLIALAMIMPETMLANVYAQSDIPATELGFTGFFVCQPDRIDVPPELKNAPASDEADPSDQAIFFEADQVESEYSQINLSGKAQVIQENQALYADQITYDRQTARAVATGSVKLYSSKGDEILADSLDLDINTFVGSANNVRVQFAEQTPYYTQREQQNYIEDYSILAPFRNKLAANTSPKKITKKITDSDTYAGARATAETITFAGADYTRLDKTTFSSCRQGDDDVLLAAKEIELDHLAGIGTVKSMTVKFKHIPIFYFPRISFPINNKRKTGFLFPRLAQEEASGSIFELPYYINISPNQDATVIPKFLSKRGVQLYGEYRYLTAQSTGMVKAEVLSADAVANADRHAFSYAHQQDFNDKWNMDIDLQKLSDTHYLSDFSEDFGVRSSSYLPQRATLWYRSPALFFNMAVASYQVANSHVTLADRPYKRLPQVKLNLKPQNLAMFNYGIDSEFSRFQHPDDRLSGRLPGTRFRANPYISLPIRRSYGYIIPKLSLQTINYTLNNPSDESPSLIVPIASIDSGLFFERAFERKHSRFVQTLEPRWLYLNIPAKLEQQMFPNFDSGSGSNSSFAHLFRENRFFGGDRVGDTHQLTLGLTSRIIDDNGKQRLKISAGQIFFLEDRKISLLATTSTTTVATASDTAHQSDFMSEVSAQINEDWNVRGFTRMDSSFNNLKFIQISADYYHSHRRNSSLSYSRIKDASAQLNLEFTAPIAHRWQIYAQNHYSTREHKTRSFDIGITYNGCCWASNLLAERYLDDSGNFKNRVTISLELGILRKMRTHF